jgi:hypothetical protein
MTTGMLRRSQKGHTDKTLPAAPAVAQLWGARTGSGPAVYFAAHPCAYGLSAVGAGGTALYALAAAARPGRRHRVMWLALGAQCAAQLVGIVAATELARRRVRASGLTKHSKRAARPSAI